MTTMRKPLTLWCPCCKPMREFVGPKCLRHLITHYTAWHDPRSPFNTQVSLVKRTVDIAQAIVQSLLNERITLVKKEER